jgi:hypothetical protein
LLGGTVQPAFTLEIDHLERLQRRTSAEMDRQSASIVRSSTGFFGRAQRGVPRRSARKVDSTTVADDASDAAGGAAGLDLASIGGSRTVPKTSSFVDAVRAKKKSM